MLPDCKLWTAAAIHFNRCGAGNWKSMLPKTLPVKCDSVDAARQQNSNLDIRHGFLIIVCKTHILGAAGFSLLAAGQKPMNRSQ
jgi:hypothetical protein